jgi:hypothetical protein
MGAIVALMLKHKPAAAQHAGQALPMRTFYGSSLKWDVTAVESFLLMHLLMVH